MGCDIWLHCEYKKNGAWHNCDNFIWNDKEEKYEWEQLYWGRNYDLFGILAGVRSREFPMIDNPRGIPDDISDKTKELYEDDKEYTHSHSYITMRELLKWKEEQTRKWKKLKKRYKVISDPDDWYGDYIVVEDANTVVYKQEHHMLDYLLQLLKIKMDNYLYCFEDDDYYNKGDDFRIVFWFDS